MNTEVPQIPIQPLRSDLAARRHDELRRIAQEGYGEVAFASSDLTVVFTVEEMAAVHEWCPAIINMRRVPPHKRKTTLVDWLVEKGESMSPPKPKVRRSFVASVRRYLRQGDEQNWQEIVDRHYEEWERGRGRKSRGPT